MKTKKFWRASTMIALILGTLVSFYSCGKECKCNGDCHGTQCSAPCADDCKCTQTKPMASIVGRWVAIIDEEDGETFVMKFREDGTGYGCEGHKENSVKTYPEYQFSYKIVGNEIQIQPYVKDSKWDNMWLDFTLSSDGKKLTIYGLDDDDLSVLHFTKD